MIINNEVRETEAVNKKAEDSVVNRLKIYNMTESIFLDAAITDYLRNSEKLAEEYKEEEEFGLKYLYGFPLLMDGHDFMVKIKLEEKMLAGELGEVSRCSFINSFQHQIYFEIFEELKEKAKVLFKDAATTDYIDTRDKLVELDRIMLNLKKHEKFYHNTLNLEGRLELEEEIMIELAFELEKEEGYVIGYEEGIPLFITTIKYYNENIMVNEDSCEYEGLVFESSNKVFNKDFSFYKEVIGRDKKASMLVQKLYTYANKSLWYYGDGLEFEYWNDEMLKNFSNKKGPKYTKIYNTLSFMDKISIIESVLMMLLYTFKREEDFMLEFRNGLLVRVLHSEEFYHNIYPELENKLEEIGKGFYVTKCEDKTNRINDTFIYSETAMVDYSKRVNNVFNKNKSLTFEDYLDELKLYSKVD